MTYLLLWLTGWLVTCGAVYYHCATVDCRIRLGDFAVLMAVSFILWPIVLFAVLFDSIAVLFHRIASWRIWSTPLYRPRPKT